MPFSSARALPPGGPQIAQVHRAVSLEGEDVVVKVQHKGVKQRILQVPPGHTLATPSKAPTIEGTPVCPSFGWRQHGTVLQ